MSARVLFAIPHVASQEPLLTAHCFGDCGKIAIGALNMGDDIGHCFVCTENNCPYEKGRVGPIGTSQQTGEVVWMRGLTNVKGREPAPQRYDTQDKG